ncbi:MAG: MOSC domain-containing protein [Ilumatobacteraceae bacterium]
MTKPIPVGPYLFTERDARKTLINAPVILDMMNGPHARGTIDHLRERLDRVLDGIDPLALDRAELASVLATVWGTLAATPATLRAAGVLPARHLGRIERINTSKGGVPKTPIDSTYVDWNGLDGDVQGAREHHGRPFQALCLWSAEVIDRLRAEGHPIFYGAAGENVTIAGLPWDDVVPGVRLRIDEVECEVWAYAVPCKKNAQWMSDGDFMRLHHDRADGRAVSRVYATVVRRGNIRTGAEVVLEP